MPQKFTNLKRGRGLKKSSQRWLLRQINDPYVERARQEGWRSRAVFKIIEIDEKFKIFKKDKIVIDLGSAPGGWSQYVVEKVGSGNVIAIDILEMDPIDGVRFFQQDFLEDTASKKISSFLKEIPYNKSGKCDIVMSDMAANTSGDKGTDHVRIINLVEESLNLSKKILKDGGYLIAKIFQGGSSDIILQQLRQNFTKVKYFKPKSSRKDSSETYLVASGFISCPN